MDWFHKMTLMRRMEQTAGQLYQQKLIRGFCHLAIGQVLAISLPTYTHANMPLGSCISWL